MRRLGYALAAVGLAGFAYLGIILWRGDPATGVYAGIQQRHLRKELAAAGPTRRPRPRIAEGRALAVIRIPRLGLNAVVVQGTSTADLRKGPGHYRITGLPGAGRVVAIAGHRTTYGAWFRHIDDLRKGDPIELDFHGVGYVYSVTGHRVVAENDWSIIRYRGYEKLVLTACHPLYSASHRWVTFARLVRARRLSP
jgi:LPXTG-site transpeptidase (sortase) family protein